MPIKVSELTPLRDKIISLLSKDRILSYSSKEIADELGIAHSTARKHLNTLFKRGILRRGKQKDYNKTFFYYME